MKPKDFEQLLDILDDNLVLQIDGHDVSVGQIKHHLQERKEKDGQAKSTRPDAKDTVPG